MNIQQLERYISIFGLSLLAGVIASCGGKNDPPAPVQQTITIAPSIGKFSSGTKVFLKKTSDGVVVASGAVGANGYAQISLAPDVAGPFLVEVGAPGDTYFDGSKGALSTIPAGKKGVRALIPEVTSRKEFAVTALTEIAVGQIEAATGGITAATAAGIIATNVSVGAAFGISDSMVQPTIIGPGTQLDTSAAGGDRYGLILQAISTLAAGAYTALDVVHDLRDDAKDGVVDGLINAAPIPSINPGTLLIGPTGASAATITAALNMELAAAQATFAPATIDVAPTISTINSEMGVTIAAAVQLASAQSGASTTSLIQQLQDFNAAVISNIGAGVSASTATAAILSTNKPVISMNPVSRGAWQVADAAVAACTLPAPYTGCPQTTITANWTAPAGVVVTQMDLVPECTHGREVVKTIAVTGGATTATIGWPRGVGQGLCPGWYNGPAKINVVLTYAVNGGAPLKLVHNYNSDDVPIVSFSPASYAAWSAERNLLTTGQTTSITVNYAPPTGTVVTGMTLEAQCADNTLSLKTGSVGVTSATVSWPVGVGQGTCPGLLPDGVTKNYPVSMTVLLDYTVNGQARGMARRY